MMSQVEDEKREERRARMAERRKEAADRWAGWLSSELGLTDAQKGKVAEVVKSYFEALQAMRQSDGGPVSRDDWRQKARELRVKSEKELGQVLDPAQMKKYEGLEDDQKIGFGMGRGGRRGGGGFGGP